MHVAEDYIEKSAEPVHNRRKVPRGAADIGSKAPVKSRSMTTSSAASALIIAALAGVPVIGISTATSTFPIPLISSAGKAVVNTIAAVGDGSSYVAMAEEWQNLDNADDGNIAVEGDDDKNAFAPTLEAVLEGDPVPIAGVSDDLPASDLLSDDSSQGQSGSGSAVYDADFSDVTAESFAGLSIDEKVELIGKMAREDDKLTGIPASLTAAQAIIESGWMESVLTIGYENYYGIKASSNGYNWPDSTWDGRVVDMATGEEYGGVSTTTTAGFRVYDNAWQSMQDHSAYLLNNTRNNGAERRYPGIEECETAEEAIDIVVEGGYATSSSYRDTIMAVVEKYGLTRFDYTATDAAMDEEASLSKLAEQSEQKKANSTANATSNSEKQNASK